ncbi:hypothetical protein ABPG74_000151 [Tetrahymena malaccensis]
MQLSGIFSSNGKDVKLSGIQDHLKPSQLNVNKPISPHLAKQSSLISNFDSVSCISEKKNLDIFNNRKSNKSTLRQRQNMKKSTSLQLKLQSGSYLLLPEQAFDLQQAKIPQTTRNFHSQEQNFNANNTPSTSGNANNYAFYKYDPNLPLQQTPNAIASPNNSSQCFFPQKIFNQKNDQNFINNLLEKEKSPTFKRNRNLSDFTSSSNQKQPSTTKLRSKHIQKSLDKQEQQNGLQNFEVVNQLTPLKLNKCVLKKEASLLNPKILNEFKEQIQNQGQTLSQNNYNTISIKYPLRSNYIIKQKNGQSLTKSQTYQIQQLTSTFQPTNQKKLNKGEFVTLFSSKTQQVNVQQPKSIIKLSSGQYVNEQYIGKFINNFDTKQICLQKRIINAKSPDINDKSNTPTAAQKEEFKQDQKYLSSVFTSRKRALSNLGIKVSSKQEKDVQTDLQDLNFQACHPYSNIVYKKISFDSQQMQQQPIINIIEAQREQFSNNQINQPSENTKVYNNNIKDQNEQLDIFPQKERNIKTSEQKMLNVPLSNDQSQISQFSIQNMDTSKQNQLKSLINFSDLHNQQQTNIGNNSIRINKFQNYDNEIQEKEDNATPKNNEIYLISKYSTTNKNSPHYFHQIQKINYSNTQQNINKDEQLNKSNLNITSANKPQLSQKQIVIAQQSQLESVNDKGKNKQYLQTISDLSHMNSQQDSQLKQNSQIFKDINLFYKQFKFSSIYENWSQQSQCMQSPKNSLKNNQDSSVDSIKNIYLQKFDGYSMLSHYQLYKNQTQKKKRGNSFFTKTNQEIYSSKAQNLLPIKKQKDFKAKDHSLTLRNEPPVVQQLKKNPQIQNISKQTDKLEEKDVFNESVQPWSRKDSELDISIF